MVSFAGPLANLSLCIVFGLASVLCAALAFNDMVVNFFDIASVSNAMLFFFNMLPIPMLDGWTVYSALIPRMEYIDPKQSQNLSWTLLIIVCITPIIDVLWKSADAVAGSVMGMWGSLVGLIY